MAEIKAQKAPRFDFDYFIKAHLTKSPWLLIWTIFLTAVTVSFLLRQFAVRPQVAIPIFLIWALSIAWMVWAEITGNRNGITTWLKDNLFSSITNALFSLILVLSIINFAVAFFAYAVTNASWSLDPETAKDVTNAGTTGARWGSVRQNFVNLMVFRMKDQIYRVWASLGLIGMLGVLSFIFMRGERFKRSLIRRILTYLWIASPLLIFYFLRGIGQNGAFYRLDIDQMWGGLLLSVIIAAFGIVFSFPIGVMLALGRQSKINGIPVWFTYLAALIGTGFLLITWTPDNWSAAETTVGKAFALSPLLILLIGFLFQRSFKGNVVAAACTVFIECIRGVPLITLLFTGIILLKIFLPTGWDVSTVGSVLVAVTLFAAAYLAENIRGGLQAIPNGQYEAADSLGLGAFSKYRRIVLPQALKIVIPAIVGQFIGLFKDTSLVALFGMFDLLQVARSISSQPQWLTIRTEPFIFIALVYFIGSYSMSAYSRYLERQLAVDSR